MIRQGIFLFTILITLGINAQNSHREKTLYFNLKSDRFLPYKISSLAYDSEQFLKDTFKNVYLPLTFTYTNYSSYEKVLRKHADVIYVNPFEKLNGTNTVLPAFLRFYENPINFKFNNENCQLELIKIDTVLLESKIVPFFIKRFEVSNYEYRQFVSYVRDSIARRILAEEFPDVYLKQPENSEEEKDEGKWDLDWSVPLRYDTEENIPLLSQMYIREEWGRKCFDSRKLNYAYTKDGKEYHINVYPDTTTFESLQNIDDQAMCLMYFWHPEYDNYPALNINWYQANAYCNWLEKKLQKELNKKIKISLPSESHWELMTAGLFSFENTNWGSEIDNSWETKLQVPIKYAGRDMVEVYKGGQEKFVMIPYKRINNEHTYIAPNYSYLISSNYFSKNEIDNKYLIKRFGKIHAKMLSDFISKSTNRLGIVALNSGASEWMQESYQHNWMSTFNTNLAGIKECMVLYYQKEYVNQFYYDINNYSDGRLVRGGSWMNDMDLSYKDGVKEKAFLNPEKAYPNVGFRYVISLE